MSITWQNELNHEWHSPEEVDDMIDRADDAKLLPRECLMDGSDCGSSLCPPVQDRLDKALEQAYAIRQVGWRVVLRAERHVMEDLDWPWRTRFEVSGFLWRHALELCKDRILGL